MNALLLALMLQAPAPATPAATTPSNRWTADPSHSAIGFRVRHLGITWVNGTFRRWTADVSYDPAKPESASVVALIQSGSIDTGNERRDNDLRSANYLASDSFPEITFRSTNVERVGEGQLRISGDLTMRGVTRPVVLDTELGGVLATSRGRRTAFTATTTIRRQDYGLTFNRLVEGAQVVGDDVRITIDLEATEKATTP